MVIGVPLHHMAAVLDELHHHVRARSHGPLVQRDATFGQAGLGIEGVGLPRHGRREGHLHPVAPLRVLALDADAQQVLFRRADSRQGPFAEIQKGLVLAGWVEALAQLGVFLLDERAVLAQTHHVFGKGAEDGRGDARRGLALECVDEVLGHQFARALEFKVQRCAALAKFARLHRVVAVAALFILGKGRMRLEQDALLDGHVVDAFGHLGGRRVVRQGLAVLVHVARLGDGSSRFGYQLERPLQVVVTVGWFVDLVGPGRLVVPVRGGRIQVPRRVFLHRRVQRIGGRRAIRPRVVVATRQCQHGSRQCQPRARRRQNRSTNWSAHAASTVDTVGRGVAPAAPKNRAFRHHVACGRACREGDDEILGWRRGAQTPGLPGKLSTSQSRRSAPAPTTGFCGPPAGSPWGARGRRAGP